MQIGPSSQPKEKQKRKAQEEGKTQPRNHAIRPNNQTKSHPTIASAPFTSKALANGMCQFVEDIQQLSVVEEVVTNPLLAMLKGKQQSKKVTQNGEVERRNTKTQKQRKELTKAWRKCQATLCTMPILLGQLARGTLP